MHLQTQTRNFLKNYTRARVKCKAAAITLFPTELRTPWCWLNEAGWLSCTLPYSIRVQNSLRLPSLFPTNPTRLIPLSLFFGGFLFSKCRNLHKQIWQQCYVCSPGALHSLTVSSQKLPRAGNRRRWATRCGSAVCLCSSLRSALHQTPPRSLSNW